MRRIASYLVLFASLVVISGGCDKSGTNCFSATGNIIRQVRTTAPFDSIQMGDNVNVILTQDAVQSVAVEAGDKIIDGITTDVVNGNLVIGNRNICNWTRNYNKPINVYISTNYLWKIHYNSSGDLTMANTFDLDSLKVEVWGGCGTISLDLDVFTGYFSENLGTADFRMRGTCAICYIYQGEYGPFHCEELNTGYCFLTSAGSNDCWVKAEKVVGATITSIGNVYYTGNPDSVYAVITGKGKLIPF